MGKERKKDAEGKHFSPSRVSPRSISSSSLISPFCLSSSVGEAGGEAPVEPHWCFLNQVHPSPFPPPHTHKACHTLWVNACVSIRLGKCVRVVLGQNMCTHTHIVLLFLLHSAVQSQSGSLAGVVGYKHGSSMAEELSLLAVPLLLSLVLPVCFNNLHWPT